MTDKVYDNRAINLLGVLFFFFLRELLGDNVKILENAEMSKCKHPLTVTLRRSVIGNI